ncbi:hypothetical protein PR003_g6546 [Phytophthora rubi]|uniref:Uncharacterized protein n=1 Tax=Phytophthora rubi TaxID=129364 RepID=A0A6A3NBN8_9STRA|nr:hypothetical protein PR001_g8260 [Phytophthora rubi]KAE9348182.1 hypothetical protein PR003_g6546 [Phytophthora rubi]
MGDHNTVVLVGGGSDGEPAEPLAAVGAIKEKGNNTFTGDFGKWPALTLLFAVNYAEVVSGRDTLLVELYATWWPPQEAGAQVRGGSQKHEGAGPDLPNHQDGRRCREQAGSAHSFLPLMFFGGRRRSIYKGRRSKCGWSRSWPRGQLVKSAEELEEANNVVVFAVVDAKEGDGR